MLTSSSSISCLNKNPKFFKVDLDGNVYCNHDMLAILRVVSRKRDRIGKEFYGCPLWPVNLENVFKSTSMANNPSYEGLKMENLKLQNKILEEENRKLRQRLSMEKYKWNSSCLLGFAIVMAIWWVLSRKS
ncbi:hypothetical protein Hanom_Chr00s000006g01614181 [Helianthus anomalus]